MEEALRAIVRSRHRREPRVRRARRGGGVGGGGGDAIAVFGGVHGAEKGDGDGGAEVLVPSAAGGDHRLPTRRHRPVRV
eukprot:7898751-Pyramimonas_sp.AAC.1